MDLEAIEESDPQHKLRKALHEFEHYIAVNKPFIPNYEDRYRNRLCRIHDQPWW